MNSPAENLKLVNEALESLCIESLGEVMGGQKGAAGGGAGDDSLRPVVDMSTTVHH